MKDFIEELKWRGMIHDMMPGAGEQLKKEMTTGYIGFDPTADSLHIGNLVQIMILVRPATSRPQAHSSARRGNRHGGRSFGKIQGAEFALQGSAGTQPGRRSAATGKIPRF